MFTQLGNGFIRLGVVPVDRYLRVGVFRDVTPG
jgi:hypothetical protein